MVPIWKQTTSNRSLVNGSADRTRLPLRPQLRFRAWAASRADATVAMGQNDSGSALQRVGRLKVEVRDGPRVFKDLVNHDQFGIGRRGRLEPEDAGTARGELAAGRTRELEV